MTVFKAKWNPVSVKKNVKPLYGHRCAFAEGSQKGVLYSFFGANCGIKNQVVSLTADGWVERAKLNEEKDNPVAAFGLARNLETFYIFGGVISAFNDTQLFIEFDCVSGEFRNIVAECSKSPDARMGCSLTFVEENLYLFGGYSNEHFLNDIWRFDLNEKKWHEIKPIGLSPEGRESHSCCLIDLSELKDKELMCENSKVKVASTKLLMIFGGNGLSGRLNDISYYDFHNSRWLKPLKETNVPPRSQHTAEFCCANGKVVVFGGYIKQRSPKEINLKLNISKHEAKSILDASKENQCDHRVALFDPLTEMWEYANSNQKKRPEARCGHGMAVDGSRILIFGGREGMNIQNGSFEILNDLWELDLATVEEEELEGAHKRRLSEGVTPRKVGKFESSVKEIMPPPDLSRVSLQYDESRIECQQRINGLYAEYISGYDVNDYYSQDSLSMGMRVQMLDQNSYEWYVGRVVYVYSGQRKVLIHYEGYSISNDVSVGFDKIQYTIRKISLQVAEWLNGLTGYEFVEGMPIIGDDGPEPDSDWTENKIKERYYKKIFRRISIN